MPEDKKEDKKEEVAPAPAVQAQPSTAKQEKKVEPKREKPSNCAACNKSVKKKRWYYRNGKYYCTHRCWKSTLKKEAKPEEAKT